MASNQGHSEALDLADTVTGSKRQLIALGDRDMPDNKRPHTRAQDSNGLHHVLDRSQAALLALLKTAGAKPAASSLVRLAPGPVVGMGNGHSVCEKHASAITMGGMQSHVEDLAQHRPPGPSKGPAKQQLLAPSSQLSSLRGNIRHADNNSLSLTLPSHNPCALPSQNASAPQDSSHMEPFNYKQAIWSLTHLQSFGTTKLFVSQHIRDTLFRHVPVQLPTQLPDSSCCFDLVQSDGGMIAVSLSCYEGGGGTGKWWWLNGVYPYVVKHNLKAGDSLIITQIGPASFTISQQCCTHHKVLPLNRLKLPGNALLPEHLAPRLQAFRDAACRLQHTSITTKASTFQPQGTKAAASMGQQDQPTASQSDVHLDSDDQITWHLPVWRMQRSKACKLPLQALSTVFQDLQIRLHKYPKANPRRSTCNFVLLDGDGDGSTVDVHITARMCTKTQADIKLYGLSEYIERHQLQAGDQLIIRRTCPATFNISNKRTNHQIHAGRTLEDSHASVQDPVASQIQQPTTYHDHAMVPDLQQQPKGAQHQIILGPSSDILGPSSDILGPSSDVLGPSSDILGPSSDVLGPSSGVLGPSSDILGPSSDILGPSSDVLGPSSDIRTKIIIGPQFGTQEPSHEPRSHAATHHAIPLASPPEQPHANSTMCPAHAHHPPVQLAMQQAAPPASQLTMHTVTQASLRGLCHTPSCMAPSYADVDHPAVRPNACPRPCLEPSQTVKQPFELKLLQPAVQPPVQQAVVQQPMQPVAVQQPPVQLPVLPAAVQPPAIQPPVQAAAVQPPVQPAAVQQPMQPLAVPQPAVQQLAWLAAVQQPIGQTAAVQQPVQSTAVQQPVRLAAAQQPVQQAAVQQPVQQPVQPAAVQQPVQPAAVQQPVQPAAVQQPLQPAAVQQPVRAAAVQESVRAAVVQQPVVPAVPRSVQHIQQAVQLPVQQADIIYIDVSDEELQSCAAHVQPSGMQTEQPRQQPQDANVANGINCTEDDSKRVSQQAVATSTPQVNPAVKISVMVTAKRVSTQSLPDLLPLSASPVLRQQALERAIDMVMARLHFNEQTCKAVRRALDGLTVDVAAFKAFLEYQYPVLVSAFKSNDTDRLLRCMQLYFKSAALGV